MELNYTLTDEDISLFEKEYSKNKKQRMLRVFLTTGFTGLIFSFLFFFEVVFHNRRFSLEETFYFFFQREIDGNTLQFGILFFVFIFLVFVVLSIIVIKILPIDVRRSMKAKGANVRLNIEDGNIDIRKSDGQVIPVFKYSFMKIFETNNFYLFKYRTKYNLKYHQYLLRWHGFGKFEYLLLPKKIFVNEQ